MHEIAKVKVSRHVNDITVDNKADVTRSAQ